MAERVIAKARTAARKKRTRESVNEAPEQGPPGADEWDSEANDYESEDSRTNESSGHESAEDAHQESTEDSVRTASPFAVVIPPPSRDVRRAYNNKKLEKSNNLNRIACISMQKEPPRRGKAQETSLKRGHGGTEASKKN
ncbi:hypothetical protein ACN38_g13174 [Penicillium nordicum]|uniref:Uncharacterized protein n=2 Tax=Penicillium nordicum TaxID=229535 RepID=A0A0M8NW24_9EURO|nr:hypothetical protein ACN38_g13174 [Penicillium nordicum]